MYVAETYMTFLFHDWLRKGCEWHVYFEILHIWEHLISSFTLDWQFGLLGPLYLCYSEFSEQSCSCCFLHSFAWTRAEHVSSDSPPSLLFFWGSVCMNLFHFPICFVLLWFVLFFIFNFTVHLWVFCFYFYYHIFLFFFISAVFPVNESFCKWKYHI